MRRRSCLVCRCPLADFNATDYCAACRIEARNGTLSVEIWLPIPGIKGWDISQFGAVRDAQTRQVRAHDLGHTYPRVTLAGARWYVHDLLARTFIGTKPLGQVVRHLDDVADHTDASNIAYGTHLENAADRIANRRKEATP